MKNLEIYRAYFDQAYPGYADREYMVINQMIQALPTSTSASNRLRSECGSEILTLILPLIYIKNYKSQIPFPIEIYSAVESIVELKNSNAEEALNEMHTSLFNRLISTQGFQLPTVSAVLHFCHPHLYPIVDVNIKTACDLLAEEHLDELGDLISPVLPAATTSQDNKFVKYTNFISFLSRLKELHNDQHQTTYDYRDLDKALMVYGVADYRDGAE